MPVYPVRLMANLAKVYGLKAQIYYPVPPREICELHYYGEDIPGDERGMD